MKYFRFSGEDSASDSGSWFMIVKARYMYVAVTIARRVLDKRGRSDLVLNDPEDLGYCTEGVIATNIELIPESHFYKESHMSVTFPVQYPQDVPFESVRECFRIAFQDHSLDSEKQAFALHGYGILGYGLKVGIGEPTAKMAASAEVADFPEACSDDEAHDALQSMLVEDSKFGALPINWLSLAMWALEQIRKRRS